MGMKASEVGNSNRGQEAVPRSVHALHGRRPAALILC